MVYYLVHIKNICGSEQILIVGKLNSASRQTVRNISVDLDFELAMKTRGRHQLFPPAASCTADQTPCRPGTHSRARVRFHTVPAAGLLQLCSTVGLQRSDQL